MTYTGHIDFAKIQWDEDPRSDDLWLLPKNPPRNRHERRRNAKVKS